MDEMIRYIFGNLNNAENTTSVFVRFLRKQKSFNRAVVFFVMMATAHMIVQNKEIAALRDEIHNLKLDIKEFKDMEGDRQPR